jgi:hypothetical protein
MEQMPADLPPFRFLGIIRLLEIDAVTGMVKVTAETGEITYIQPAQALKFAEWALGCRDQLAEAQNHLDADVREARQRLGQKTSFTVSLWEGAESPEPRAVVPIVAKMPLSAMIFAMQRARISSAGYVLVSSDEIEAEFYHVKLTGEHITYDRAVPGPPPDRQG